MYGRDLSRLISLVLSADSRRACRAVASEGVGKADGGGAADDGGGAGAGATSADDGAPKLPETIPVERHNAGMARMRTELAAAKKALEETQARLSEYDEKQKTAEEAKLTSEERVNKRLKEIETKHANELAEARKMAEVERSRRHEILVRNALLSEIGKAGPGGVSLYDAEIIVDALAKQVTVTEGDEVARVVDGLHTSVKDVVAEWAKAHPRFVPNVSQSGTGDKGGKGPRVGRKLPGEMSGAELEAAVLEEANGMTGQQQTQTYR